MAAQCRSIRLVTNITAIMNTLHYRIILASNSPRRKQLLQALDIPFEVRTMKDIDEHYPEDISTEDIPLFLSKKKAEAYRPTLSQNELLITADTIVVCNGKVLGKPCNAEEAHSMLSLLSGRQHHVITGVALTTTEQQTAFTADTVVTFAQLTTAEIDYYITHYKPFDKAGAYGIQEWIGHTAITQVNGSYFNVVGLPVARLFEELKHFGAISV